ncbi:hypothetical protein LX36DRAFT_167183 [Colletotrichum falcatum]|nr:hypothetical protein LX36DRAFT_167183 [Colletotrichum falcatum]
MRVTRFVVRSGENGVVSRKGGSAWLSGNRRIGEDMNRSETVERLRKAERSSHEWSGRLSRTRASLGHLAAGRGWSMWRDKYFEQNVAGCGVETLEEFFFVPRLGVTTTMTTITTKVVVTAKEGETKETLTAGFGIEFVASGGRDRRGEVLAVVNNQPSGHLK